MYVLLKRQKIVISDYWLNFNFSTSVSQNDERVRVKDKNITENIM